MKTVKKLLTGTALRIISIIYGEESAAKSTACGHGLPVYNAEGKYGFATSVYCTVLGVRLFPEISALNPASL